MAPAPPRHSPFRANRSVVHQTTPHDAHARKTLGQERLDRCRVAAPAQLLGCPPDASLRDDLASRIPCVSRHLGYETCQHSGSATQVPLRRSLSGTLICTVTRMPVRSPSNGRDTSVIAPRRGGDVVAAGSEPFIDCKSRDTRSSEPRMTKNKQAKPMIPATGSRTFPMATIAPGAHASGKY